MSQPSDLEQLADGLVLLDRLISYGIVPHYGSPDNSMEWIVPPGVLDGVSRAYGLPVRHVAGVEAPYLAHRIDRTRAVDVA